MNDILHKLPERAEFQLYCCPTAAIPPGGALREKPTKSHLSCKFAQKKRADERTRTADLLITNELLYLLSYVGLLRGESISQRGASFIRWAAV